MSGWAAINLEPDDDPLDLVDDTKELQLEEAFKLYQNALKLHSQGPAYYDAAREAYDELFQSEVFKYPEAASEFDHDQTEDALPALQLPATDAILPVSLGAAADTANSLSQLVYLAYKSRAQFLVDTTHALYNQLSDKSRSVLFDHYALACLRSLSDAAAALERDDTDLDLWKRASRVSDVLHTVRIVRFCLESVLAGDDEGEDAIDLSGLDEAFAKGELQSVLNNVDDPLAKTRTSDLQPRDGLLSLLRHSNDPYPFLPQRARAFEYLKDVQRPLFFAPLETHLPLSSLTQLSIAQALLQIIVAHAKRNPDLGVGGRIRIELPHSAELLEMESSRSPKTKETEQKPVNTNPIVGTVDEIEIDSPASFHSVPDEVQVAVQTPHASGGETDSRDESASHPPATEETGGSTLVAESVALPSRKRSSTAAGNEEPEARARSKRIKARESLVGSTALEEDLSQDPSFLHPAQIANIESADDMTFKLINDILEKIGVTGLGRIDDLRGLLGGDFLATPGTSTGTSDSGRPLCNLGQILVNWNEENSSAFSTGHGGRDHLEKSTGLSLFLKHSKPALAKEATPVMVDDPHQIASFIRTVNTESFHYTDSLFLWLLQLLTFQPASLNVPPYLQGTWSADFKQTLMQIIIAANEQIVSTLIQYVQHITKARSGIAQTTRTSLSLAQATEFAQAMFELHLDVYSEITDPTSIVDSLSRKQQSERLEAWSQIATDVIHLLHAEAENRQDGIDAIALRFLWASIFYAKLSDSVDKGHVLLCLADLQRLLELGSIKEILLPNNTAMPFISVSAAEQEISKLRTMEFFMGVFDTDNSEPESVITKLEPVLEYGRDFETWSATLAVRDREEIENFQSFLSTGDASLTLFLWKRLQNAYGAISYNTKVVSCLLRSIETICAEIYSIRHTKTEVAGRDVALLRWLRDVDDLVAKTLGRIADDKAAFECIDEPHLRSSISAVVTLLRLMYEFVLMDDSLRVGSSPPPHFRTATANKNFEKCRDRFREMTVRLWTLLYLMIKEAKVQIPHAFDGAEKDLIVYLRCVHASLGERQYCKHCNKLFVRMAKTEFFSFGSEEDLSIDIAQVAYDLYGVKLSTGYGDVDHGCTAEPLEKDKRTAHTLVPIVMDYVKRLNVKDLLKSDLKTTIDRIQSALGQVKPSPAVSFNRRAASAYLKSVVNPQNLFQARRGIGELGTKAVHTEFAHIAAQGWYLLLGNMTLAKYKSVKRVNPTPTDDLDNALGFLRQDIEHNSSNWESWYRLAQGYDAKIEDNLIWNSQKLNDARAELATLERNAINAYTMATAMAMRSEDASFTMKEKMNDMFFEFATRLYSSSRPPLEMEAFNTEKAVKHLSNYVDQSMSKQAMFRPMSEYSLWSFAAHLIRLSLSSDSKSWVRYYLLGKCLWKMFRSPTNLKVQTRVQIDDIIEAFSDAVKYVPKKERSSDPILEPHSKLVSTVHKLQDIGAITIAQAVQYLQVTQYARGIQITDDEDGKPNWETYILSVLKRLQTADKSGWHHRITARAAHVVYNNGESLSGALGAKHQFTQSIFTKTMTMQVWKPEHERAGRHYVYTGRYLRFFVEILDKLGDRSNLEQVVRRIRRKTTDFINHLKIWEDTVIVYVDLLRKLGNVPRGHERDLFDNITFDEFTRQSEKLEKWAHDPETSTTYLDLLQDAIELKKLNNSLMKGPAIDDLIGDTYAAMYELFVSQLPPEEQVAPKVDTLPQGTFINMTSETAPTGDDNLDRMRLNNLLSSQTDGASGSAVENGPSMAGLGIIAPAAQPVGTPPPDAIRMPVPGKPGRAKTITRREVQKKAEAAIVKPPPIKTPTLTKRLIVNVPSIRKDDESEAGNDDGDRSVRDQANGRSGLSSRRGSVSMRNSAEPELAEDDDGGDGDNEDEGDDENENSDTEIVEEDTTRKRLFPGLVAAATKADDDDDADEEEDDDSGEDKTSEGKAEDDEAGPEIPDSQDVAEIGEHDKDEMEVE
ncbi:Histone transcription regulator 3 [Neophaeococcomyces mojaviensis]|uniref:Histone transcription regulator 3 n=1 Tax=Neophaeococcomyces mojaviensis TaxID=3383035 RepID=A0ACC2ZZ88_9EURO|nr:Histone transcription regulator 3 [Knufia sp. JES_112]